MLVNLSNHPSDRWGQEQIDRAEALFGDVVDISFPNVPPTADEREVLSLVDSYVRRVDLIIDARNERLEREGAEAEAHGVHLMGETSFVALFAQRWAEKSEPQHPLLCSTTAREVVEQEDGTKVSRFHFVRFREITLW